MKTLFVILFCLATPTCLFAQQPETAKIDSISNYFKELKQATKAAEALWNKDIYGGVLLVDPKTRKVYSNEADIKNSLELQKDIYTGTLPNNINIANTALKWNDKTWAMIMLPLSSDKNERINLLTHELFHAAQQSLGFTQNNKESNHLDQKDGRIYLRLELEALKKAITTEKQKEQKKHLTNALTFRKYRHTLFPESNNLENQLELNEGLAEYTGVMMSNRDSEQMKQHFVKSANAFVKNPTYVRSFAYQTTPMYGYLLSKKDKSWNQKISAESNLTDYFIKNLGVKLSADLKGQSDKIQNDYNGVSITQEEQIREEEIKKRIAAYKAKLIELPHLEIKFEKMNVSFDPRNILPIEDKGTVYPQIRVTDNWGILEVSNGALMHPNWNKISISSPTTITEDLIEGDGWKLQLNKGYQVVKDETNANFKLVKMETQQFKSAYADVNGIKMYYEIYGKGKPLVLIHGGGSTIQSNFEKVIPLLAKNRQVIAVELQAHGRTSDRNADSSFEQDAKDVKVLLEQLQISKADFLGFSNGGTTAMQIAIQFPAVVDKLILGSALAKRNGVPEGFWAFMKQASLADMPEELKKAFLKVNSDPKALQVMHDRDAKRMVNFKDISDEKIKSIKAPTLIIIGDKDIITPEHAREMKKLISNSELLIIPGGHGEYIGEVTTIGPQYSEGKLALPAIEKFLNK